MLGLNYMEKNFSSFRLNINGIVRFAVSVWFIRMIGIFSIIIIIIISILIFPFFLYLDFHSVGGEIFATGNPTKSFR